MEEVQKITKEMRIGEVIEKYPKTASVFRDYNLHCFGCPMAAGESLEELAKLHEINLEKFLQDLNKVAESS